jgi:hypothetical protein
VNTEEFNNRIREVFPEANVPANGAVIAVTIPHDDEVRIMLEGKSWGSLPPAVVDCLFGDLILLRPEALRYYVPAFLQRAVASRNEHHVELLIDTLDPRVPDKQDRSTSEAEWRRNWGDNLQKFSPAQREVVRDFVRWASTCNNVDIANGVLEFWEGPQ